MVGDRRYVGAETKINAFDEPTSSLSGREMTVCFGHPRAAPGSGG